MSEATDKQEQVSAETPLERDLKSKQQSIAATKENNIVMINLKYENKLDLRYQPLQNRNKVTLQPQQQPLLSYRKRDIIVKGLIQIHFLIID